MIFVLAFAGYASVQGCIFEDQECLVLGVEPCCDTNKTCTPDKPNGETGHVSTPLP